MFSVINAFAPTIQFSAIMAPFRIVLPMPISVSSSTVQPCSITECPMLTLSPSVQGKSGSAWITVPS